MSSDAPHKQFERVYNIFGTIELDAQTKREATAIGLYIRDGCFVLFF